MLPLPSERAICFPAPVSYAPAADPSGRHYDRQDADCCDAGRLPNQVDHWPEAQEERSICHQHDQIRRGVTVGSLKPEHTTSNGGDALIRAEYATSKIEAQG